MPTSRHLPCVAYFTCPRSRLNSPSARLFLIDRINEHKSGKKPLITARSLLAWSGCPRWRVVGKRVSQVAQTDCVRNRAKWNVAARFRPTSRGAVRLAVRDQSRCRIRLQSINNNIQFWVFKRQRFVYRLRYRSSFHQNENFIQEIESLLASLENFTIKKKKNWSRAFGNRGLERIFESRFSERIRSRRVERQSRLSFREPSSFYAPSPPSPLEPASVPLPGRARPRFYVELFAANTVSGGRMSEETETHWHRFHAHFLFFTFEIS